MNMQANQEKTFIYNYSDLLKGTAKFAIGTCVTLCAVTVTVGKSLSKVVLAGFTGAKGAIKEERG